jgi:hypothetical protein
LTQLKRQPPKKIKKTLKKIKIEDNLKKKIMEDDLNCKALLLRLFNNNKPQEQMVLTP